MSRRIREHHFQSAVTDSIRTYRGTPYACNERDINLATWDFSDDNIRPYVSASEANRELVQHNDERRPNPPHERDAIRRLTYAMAEAKAGYWGPDLMIKCFLDFDVMFFGGVLRGNCHVDWIDFNDPYWPLDQAVRGNNLGITNLGITRYLRTGRALIWLNARGIFLSPIIANPFKAAFFTLLHEMCHAFEWVRVRHEEIPNGPEVGHGSDFRIRIHAVNRRAKNRFDLEALTPWERYGPTCPPALDPRLG